MSVQPYRLAGSGISTWGQVPSWSKCTDPVSVVLLAILGSRRRRRWRRCHRRDGLGLGRGRVGGGRGSKGEGVGTGD